jgi:hypothetical protein
VFGKQNDDCLLMQQLSGLLVICDDMKSFPFDNMSEKIFFIITLAILASNFLLSLFVVFKKLLH